MDIKDEIQNLLFDLVKEKMVLWKQMRCLELAAALVAETLIEMGVQIVTNPDEIHWPTGHVSKPSAPLRKKKGGKKTEKNKHGVFGQIVADLAPKLPADGQVQVVQSENSNTEIGTQEAKVTRSKNKNKKSKSSKNDEDVIEIEHEGLPVQPRKCKFKL